MNMKNKVFFSLMTAGYIFRAQFYHFQEVLRFRMKKLTDSNETKTIIFYLRLIIFELNTEQFQHLGFGKYRYMCN